MKKHILKWMQEDWDEKDNPVWSAASFYYYDDSPFYYRIKQVLERGFLFFALCHDEELMGEDDKEMRFSTLDDAQEYCQDDCNESLKNELKLDGRKKEE